MQLAYPLAQEVYPHLMRPDVNAVPFWLPWLWPVPADARRPWSLARALYLLLFTAGATGVLLALMLLYYVALDQIPSWRPSPLLADLSALTGTLLAIPLLRVIYHALPLVFRPRRRRLTRWRKRLASVLALQHGLGPASVGMLLENDEPFALHLQRFLADHHVPYALPLYDAHGRYVFACPGKVDVLARALLQSVGRGHDNELFVLLADLVELPDQLDPLLRAVRVALARHHQVVVVCPWPPGLPPPDEHPTTGYPSAGLYGSLQRATALHFQAAFQQLRRKFARLGVPVIWSAREDSVRLILERMDRLRGLGRRR
jgi:hypothetical protein